MRLISSQLGCGCNGGGYQEVANGKHNKIIMKFKKGQIDSGVDYQPVQVLNPMRVECQCLIYGVVTGKCRLRIVRE